ncbi:MAG: YfhO family protein [Bacteroidales bacterium]|nr:YfhO family protein [Bacteroidales bacterium]MDT8432407.1 YfhO family protein [Bacteroidales bacterium]
MLRKIDFSKALPHIVALVIFLLISFAYFSPVLEGKRLNQHDQKTFMGGAKEIIDYREATDEEALWTNSMFGGMPAYLISTEYKGNLIQHLNRLLQVGPRPGSQLFLLLLGGYILFISLRINPWLSMVGAIAIAFSSYNFIIILAGHNTKVIAIAYVAPVLAGIFMTFRGKRLLGAALTGVFLSLQILAGHPQITYYTIFIVLFFGVSEFYFSISERKLKDMLVSVGFLVVVVAFAVLSNFSRLATTLEYDDHSMRTKSELSQNEEDKTEGLNLSYATNWSYGIDETMTLLIPGFKGGSSAYELSENSNTYEALARLDKNFASQFIQNANMYWGDQVSTSGPVYLGAIIIFLFVLGLFIVEGRYKWWILGVAVLAIMLSWGKNFMGLTEFFMHNVPGYNKFRTVSMTLVIPQIVVPILALLALDKVLFGGIEKDKLLKGLKWSAGITGGLALLFLVIPSMAGNFSSPNDVRTIQAISGNNPQVQQMLMSTLPSALEADREAMLRTDSFRSLVFILLAAGLIYLYRIRKQKLNVNLVIGLFGILVLVDMWPVNKRFLDDDNFESKQRHTQPYTATTADQAIFQIKGLNERVLNLTTSTFQDARTSYFHHSLGGYHGAKMRRYQDLIDTRLVDEMTMLIGGLQQQDFDRIDSVLSELNIINMLNTRFIIINPESAPLNNRHALGNSWFVDEVIPAENADEELELVSTADLSSIALTDQKFLNRLENTSFQGNTSDRIELVDYLPNQLTYTSSAASERFAVFSEIFYDKGWKVTVDGEPADHIRVDYLLRGMTVPAGEHTIVFEFRPRSYYAGERISLAGSLVMLLMLAGAIIMEFRRKAEDQ